LLLAVQQVARLTRQVVLARGGHGFLPPTELPSAQLAAAS
jgi:hypothetical protein